MYESLHHSMIEHAVAVHPQAACGGVFGDRDDPVFLPVEGAAAGTRENFQLEMSVLQRMERSNGPLLAVMYSHPSRQSTDIRIERVLFTPSASEMRWQMSAAVPFIIAVSSPTGVADLFWFGDQCPIPPLEGRTFRHGVTDCYSLARDWYRLERNLCIPDYPRDWDWWTAGEEGPNLYKEGFEAAGFRPIRAEDAVEGDAVLFQIRSRVINHAAVLLKDGWMIHHPAYTSAFDYTRTSHRVKAERWLRHATHWLRHHTVPD